jgi:hypothetical protein
MQEEICCCTGNGEGPCILSCATVEFEGVTRCDDVELESADHPPVPGLWWAATGEANGTYELPKCENNFWSSFCGQIGFSHWTTGTQGDDGPFLTDGSWINVSAYCAPQSVHGVKLVPDPQTVEAGDTYNITTGGETLSYTATSSDPSEVITALTDLINGVGGASPWAVVEALDMGFPAWTLGDPIGHVLVRPRTRQVPAITATAVNGGVLNNQYLSVLNVDIPMFAVEVSATATFIPTNPCGDECEDTCPIPPGYPTLPIFYANALVPCCPEDGETITLTNGVIAWSPTYFEYDDETLVYAPDFTDGQSVFWECAASYDGGNDPNAYGANVDDPDCYTQSPFSAPVIERWGKGGTVTVTWHKHDEPATSESGSSQSTGDGACPDPLLRLCPPPCVTVTISGTDVSGASVPCHAAEDGFRAVDYEGTLDGEYVISPCNMAFGASPCTYCTVECHKFTGVVSTGPTACDTAGDPISYSVSVCASYTGGFWDVFVGSGIGNIGGTARFADCEVGTTKPLILNSVNAGDIGGSVTLTLTAQEDADDCPVADCHEGCSDEESDGDNSSSSSSQSLSSESSSSADECLTCDDCPTYKDDPDFTYLTAHIEINAGECGDCHGDAIGGGCLECCDCDCETCRGCGCGPGGVRALDCICHFYGPDISDCLGGGGDPYCNEQCIANCIQDGGTPEECGVFSPCSIIRFNGDIELPLVSHTSTTMTFQDITIFTAYGNMNATVVFDCDTKSYYWTIYISRGGNSTRCKMDGTWTAGGSGCDCTGCDGPGLPMEDTVNETNCTGNGAIITGATINREGC